MKKTFAAVLCMALLLSGCAGEKEEAPDRLEIAAVTAEAEAEYSAFPAEVCGVTLPAAVSRAVSLSPAATEIIAELGFAGALVGVSAYCDYPESIDAPRFGSAENPDLDGIIALKPDAVFTLTALAERDIYALQTAGIAVIKLNAPTSMEEYAAMYRDAAAAFYGKELTSGEKQTEVAAQLGSSKRAMLESFAGGVQLGNFIYVTGKGTLAGAGTFENAMLSLSGTNLCTGTGYAAAAEFSGTPDIIIADSTLTEDELRADSVIAGLLDGGAKAVFVTARCFERPTIRSADVFTELSEQLKAETAE